MTATRLHWLSKTRLGVLRSRLSEAFEAWQTDWSVDPQPFKVDAQPMPSVQAVGWTWFRASGKHGDLCFGARIVALDGLAARLTKAGADNTLDLGRRVGQRALQALLAQWADDAHAVVSECDSPHPSEWRGDRGTAAFHLAADVFEARALVSADLGRHWAPPAPATSPALTPRQAVLGRERVQLEVVLDLGDTPLSEAQGLQVGDVLVTRASLDRAFALHVPGARHIAAARLYSQDGRRALLIDQPHAAT